ncbi:3-hydroxyacyl-CoA dehydrogenase PaaH [Motiliproteus sp. MSK22-1]|uniref:3-hydroxyacyl-CoA dehydrogenase PaaH n=1 Tax=Motiliproteus sp. MSK22-1 TaxID=1897630 RepID=UPI000977FF2A|nr:3-hydroxyacyl-CoA dehydrogenase PaaH [Motiliproteus sp. MSK22-1]OMH38340.1 3-hydroxyacyl-CoA dehydrogenase PaaC [Motiliproteus sp. MSK22-1]
MNPLSKESSIGVIGAGTMGAGIAQVAATFGHNVLLFDQNADAIQRGLDQTATGLAKQVSRGKLDELQRSSILSRMQATTELKALAGCDLIIEAIVEDLTIKRELLAQLESHCTASTILATNTSSISITALSAGMTHPERLLGMHFFNPAPVMKLVEVVSGIATDTDIAEKVHATAIAWGKKAVHATSTPGFIVNRVARPFYAEALRILEEGATDIPTIDYLIKSAGGFRMGPFELMDMIGHDVNYAVTCSVFEAYYRDPRFLPSLTQKALVDSNRLGRKSGQGFYSYSENSVHPSPSICEQQPLPKKLSVVGNLSIAAPLLKRAQEQGIAIDQQPPATASDAGYIQAGNARLMLTDGRFASERASVENQPDTVLFDLALDYYHCSGLAISVAGQCSDKARNDAIGFLQALGINVSQVDDSPGLVVMRTVSMLANEAADAVNQGVCSAADADTAMQSGVNYPLGPLAWADKIGISATFNCLMHLQQSYGEDRYRPSPLLRRMNFSRTQFHHTDVQESSPA